MTKLPKYPRGAPRGSERYREWAREYARAKRALTATQERPPVDSVRRAAVELLVAVAASHKADGTFRIPEAIWGEFMSLKRKSSSAATALELDILARCVCA